MKRYTRKISVRISESAYLKLRQKALKESDSVARIIRKILERSVK